MKAVIAAFNQEKALVGAFFVITNLRMELFGALVTIDEMIVIIMTGWCRYVLVKYATRGLVQGGSVAPLFNILYALAVATFMAIHLLRTAANILQVQGGETVSRGYTVSRLTRTR